MGIAAAARLVGLWLPLPPVALALAFGLALSHWGRREELGPGLAIAVRPVLRVGVALLGATISLTDFVALGWATAGLTVGALLLTLLGGSWLGRRMGEQPGPAMVAAGAVAICGASASLAIAAALPPGSVKDRDIARTLAGITIVGSIGMLLYPLLAKATGMSPHQTGIFLGASLHEVAQAVAAGVMVGDEAGKAATIVKMLRVACLGLVVIGIGMAARRGAESGSGGARVPLLPGFLLAFALLAAIASAGLIPPPLIEAAREASRWCLLVAIAALGLKTSPSELGGEGLKPLLILVLTSLLLALLVLGGLWLGVGR
ncbi:putative sulfate exporter family transporter [Sphingomonas swuensis]|uniref:Sulfate exporter family transporter n=1 Tax=Sphingomonas swuensis TaxID=977800 RepID=A0ABP7SKG7_9SPHN